MIEELERSISEFEKVVGLPVTIVDNNGCFRSKQRRWLFSPERSSHKKNSYCRAKFSEHCIRHCRNQVGTMCRHKGEPFVETCPHGVRQLIFPLNINGVNYGIFYLGCWRISDAPSDEYRALPLWQENKKEELLALGRVYACGVLAFLKSEKLLIDEPDLRAVKVRDFLEQHLSESIGLPDLAQLLNLSESYTSVLIKQLFGYTFSGLIRRFRVERAKQYLNGTELNLHRIAALCGFAGEFHLSRVFKQETGVAPSVFRNNPVVKH